MNYKVRFVNPQRQYKDHKKEFLSIIDDVLSRGDLIMRSDLEIFENRLAKFVGVKYAVGLNSGTDALSLAFEAQGLKPGDEVITVAHTFMASISAIAHHGAKPILIDVGKDFNMDADKIEKAITKKTKAIEPVHLNGRMCDMEKITAIAKKYNLFVVEDAAQSLGAKMKTKNGRWKMAGSFGVAGCFSFFPFKSLGCFGDGGALVTNDKEFAHNVKLLRYNGEDRKTRKFYYHGYTCLLDNMQAAILNKKLEYFPQWVKRRQNIAKQYRKGLLSIKEITLPHFSDTRFVDAYQNYAIRTKRRNELAAHLAKKGVEILISWDTPTYAQPAMKPNGIFLPETEKICKEVISLPMYPELTDKEIQYVISAVRNLYS